MLEYIVRNRHASDIVANLMLAIDNQVIREFPKAEVECRIDKADADESIAVLYLRREGIGDEFAQVQIRVYETDTGLTFEIFSELEIKDHLNDLKMESVNIKEMLEKYRIHTPVITESVIHSCGVPKETTVDYTKTKAVRSLKISLRIFEEEIEPDEDGAYNYDLDEISSRSVPCIRALHDVHKTLFSGIIFEKNGDSASFRKRA